jgi:hypothetical protein
MFRPGIEIRSECGSVACPNLVDEKLCTFIHCFFSHRPDIIQAAKVPLPDDHIAIQSNDNAHPDRPKSADQRLKEIVEGNTQWSVVGRSKRVKLAGSGVSPIDKKSSVWDYCFRRL